MKRVIGLAARLAGLALTLAFAGTAAANVQTQLALPEHTAKATASTTQLVPEQLDEAKEQLRQALAQRDRQAIQHNHIRQDNTPDKQRLLDWLVDLQREKTKLLEELLALRTIAAPAIDDDPLVKALQGSPPYSALQVDALRDEIDGLKEKLAAAEAGFRAKQSEMRNLRERLEAREAASRQAGERTLGARSELDAAKARDELEVFALLKRAAEVEIAVAALEQERLKLQIAAWRKRIDDLLSVVAKVLPDQTLTQEDLALQQQRVRGEQDKLASEIAQASKQNARHRAERDRAAKPSVFLDFVLKSDNAILKGLEHLQILNSVSGNAWEKRYTLLSGTDPEQRAAALAALNELQRKLADWHNQYGTQQEALKTDIRSQRIRLENLAGDSREQVREKENLNLLLRQTAMNERVELAVTRLEKQLSRWLADVATPGDKGFRSRVTWVLDNSATILKRIWEQELFVAEDVSEVDGRQVSVKYGITVGKGVSLIVVFVLGYWLLARISRFIQHQLVRRLKVSHQLASVIRRWSMIGLSIALILLLLNLARIPLSVFAFLGGALAIGVGFGTQTIIKNFISGLIVLFERKVRVGDVVELGGVTGYVTAVDLRATTVHGFNGVEALIPNANFIENQVINWTYSSRQVRRELQVDVAYGTDVRQAEALFLAAANEHPHVLKNPVPEVFFDGFGDSALKVVLVYWIEFEAPLSPRRADSDLRHDIYRRLTASGISIPFPQRVLHVNLAQPVVLDTASREPVHAQ